MKHSSNLKDVRCKRGVNADSDHYLLVADVLARISMNKTQKRQRVRKYNVQSLEKEEVQQAFRSKIMKFNESTCADEESQRGIEKQINNRITLAYRSYIGLVNILKAKNKNEKHKVIIYKTLIKPVLMYVTETWVLIRQMS